MPKIPPEVREMARAATPLAIATLREVCEHGDKDAARVAAAVALLDRAWGKPAQSLELHGPEDGAAELRLTIARLRADPLSAQAMLTIAELAASSPAQEHEPSAHEMEQA
jgi:hypothetical protein